MVPCGRSTVWYDYVIVIEWLMVCLSINELYGKPQISVKTIYSTVW